MRKTKRKAATTVYFGCRLDAELVEQVRERAERNRRPIGAELARILEYALPSMDGFEERMEQARREAFEEHWKQRMKMLKTKIAKEGR
jgi:Arc-like DNA binding domain